MSQLERWIMQATSLTGRLRRSMVVRDWAWWRLPPTLRWYVAALPVAAVVSVTIVAIHTDWRVGDLAKFALLMCCGVISVASTPREVYSAGVSRDFSTIWVIPTAVLLPPVYAALMPIPISLVMQFYVYRGVVHRRVFTAAAISLGYMAASLVFRAFPASIAGGTIGSGMHAATWALAVAACEIVGGRGHHFLIVGAVKLTNPAIRIRDIEWNRKALQEDFAEMDLGILITMAVVLSPVLAIVAVPTVLLVRRFLVHPALVTRTRIDAKTGLLNISTWEREAEAELSRAIRTRTASAVAIVDIDHFKRVNDTYGHLVGDRVLKSVATALEGQLRDYDRAGRFGGEEFVLLLAQSGEDEATGIAERLRKHIGAMAVPIDDRPDAPCVSITISIGVAAMERGQNHQLTDLLAAADSSLYQAKEAGRNRISVAQSVQHGQLVAEIATQIGLVQGDPAGASLCPAMSL